MGNVARLKINKMDKLRDEFFKKHVKHKTTDGIPVISTHPHNLFEWFKDKMKGQALSLLDVSNCTYIDKLEKRCKDANFAPYDDRVPKNDNNFEWDFNTISIAENWLAKHHNIDK